MHQRCIKHFNFLSSCWKDGYRLPKCTWGGEAVGAEPCQGFEGAGVPKQNLVLSPTRSTGTKAGKRGFQSAALSCTWARFNGHHFVGYYVLTLFIGEREELISQRLYNSLEM